MSQDTPKTPSNIFPCLAYQDAPAAIEWLARAFGFEKRMVAPGPDGTIAHAEMSLGPGLIMLGSVHDNGLAMKSPRDLAGVNQVVYVCVADVDAHYARARAAGAEIVRELADTDYGAREYCARDLEQHVWSFGTYRPSTD